MATFEGLHDAARLRFETLVETPEAVVVIYDNSPIDPPEDALHVRMKVRPGTAFRVENGGAPGQHRFRTPGILVSDLKKPLGKGEEDIMQLADVIAVAFRAVTAGGITYLTPSVETKGRQDDGRWWLVTVTCPFYSDEIA